MFQWTKAKSRFLIIALIVLVCSTLIAAFAYRTATTASVMPSPTATKAVKIPIATPSLAITPTIQPSPTPTPIPSGSILGVESNLLTKYTDIPWVRYGYPTCGVNTLSGDALKTWITIRHSEGVHILITTCQVNGASLFDPKPLQALVESGADAVQCGNEQIKYDPGNTSYVPPAQFARYFDLCEHTVHAMRPDIPVLL